MLSSKRLLDFPIIQVTEKQTIWDYEGCRLPNGMVIYTAPTSKHNHQNVKVDEFMFLPLSVGDFRKHQDENCGFRFIFSSDKYMEIKFLGDCPNGGITTLELTFSVSRIRLRTIGRRGVVIRSVMAPLFPPETITLSSTSCTMCENLSNFITKVIMRYGTYYYNNIV